MVDSISLIMKIDFFKELFVVELLDQYIVIVQEISRTNCNQNLDFLDLQKLLFF